MVQATRSLPLINILQGFFLLRNYSQEIQLSLETIIINLTRVMQGGKVLEQRLNTDKASNKLALNFLEGCR